MRRIVPFAAAIIAAAAPLWVPANTCAVPPWASSRSVVHPRSATFGAGSSPGSSTTPVGRPWIEHSPLGGSRR